MGKNDNDQRTHEINPAERKDCRKIAASGYLTDSFSHVLLANYEMGAVYFALPIALAEIAFPPWRLFKGVNADQWEKRA
ncbi:MAG TPA: hypothetical protein VFT66_18280 [Roseiflexaceae bacterium]|jgi:hypothetical protein|nr:hypothetical protein [Roseiflexaceae bacterium]